MNFEKKFNLGETKYVDLLVRAVDNLTTVVVSTASWGLFFYNQDFAFVDLSFDDGMPDGFEQESTGNCVIDSTNKMVSSLITPQKRGLYVLKVTYVVGEETRIVLIRVDVM